MTHTRMKFSVAGIGLALAVGYLALAGVKQGWVYHVEVDQFLKDAQYQQQRVRVCGKVAEDGLQMSAAHLQAGFVLLGQSGKLPVLYRGAIPDMFKAGGEVVVEGRLDKGGVFQADVLMTKCASKYQSEEHAQRVKEIS